MRYVETDKQHGGAVSLAAVLGMILTLQKVLSGQNELMKNCFQESEIPENMSKRHVSDLNVKYLF